MNKLLKRKRKGSLTVEATLVLPLVIISLLFIANILNICMVHACMQQALNNTAKKISQDSYIVYRFAGEKHYEDFMNGLNKAEEGYAEFESKATDTKNSLNELQSSAANTIKSFGTLWHTFDEKNEGSFLDKLSKFPANVDNLIDSLSDVKDKSMAFKDSIGVLFATGKENIKSIAIKLLIDSGSGVLVSNLSEHVFNEYVKELSIPASKIENLSAFHSRFNASDGSFTMAVTYTYKNPFSFINKQSLEYSVINRNIRMTNVITIKPFIGKNGTSLIKSENSSESSSGDSGEAASLGGDE